MSAQWDLENISCCTCGCTDINVLHWYAVATGGDGTENRNLLMLWCPDCSHEDSLDLWAFDELDPNEETGYFMNAHYKTYTVPAAAAAAPAAAAAAATVPVAAAAAATVPVAAATTHGKGVLLYGFPHYFPPDEKRCSNCLGYTRSSIWWTNDKGKERFLFVCAPFYSRDCEKALNARVGRPGEVHSVLFDDTAPKTPPSSDDEDDAAAAAPAPSFRS